MITPLSNSPALSELPNAFAILLDSYSAITLSGDDQSKYLQGQVTCDVNSITEQQILNGAHCNAKGKVISAFRLFNYQGKHLLFQPKSIISSSLSELKKFGVFAKVMIAEANDLAFIIIAGKDANQVIAQHTNQIPDKLSPVVNQGDLQFVYLAGEIPHFLCVAPKEHISTLLNAIALPTYASPVWQLLEINEGFPALSASAIEQYVPQMLNLQAINGISFTKGCYLGQETVARMQYLGKNKRALFHLSGNASQPITSGNVIEMQLGDNWRKAGDIITYYQDDQGIVSLQAVLTRDIEPGTHLRIKNDEESSFTMTSLPYSLND